MFSLFANKTPARVPYIEIGAAATSRLRDLKVGETGVCKVVRERAYTASWHPSNDKLLLAVGDKVRFGFGAVALQYHGCCTAVV